MAIGREVRRGKGGLEINISAAGLAEASKRLGRLLDKFDNLAPAMEIAAQYMVNATKGRIASTKRSPSGIKWARLSEITVELKGHAQLLWDTGNLYWSIKKDVRSHGFTVYSDAPYAYWVQNGRDKTRGKIRSDRDVPPRVFMGFSEYNLRAIAERLRDHLKTT